MAQKAISAPIKLRGDLSVSGDKSISHRLLMLSSIASGKSIIENLSPGADCLSTMRCLRALGITIIKDQRNPHKVTIVGKGKDGLEEPDNVLNAGNSGTTTRLLGGILAAQPFLSIITGDRSLRSRPMRRLIDPLTLMGADICGKKNGAFAPIVIRGKKLHGINYRMKIASAQIKSAIILAALFAEGDTTIEELSLTRDHTERLLKQMGAGIKINKNKLFVSPLSDSLSPVTISVPGDFSSAAFWLVAGIIHPNASITVTNCGVNPTRTGLIDVLQSMGANISIGNQRLIANEPVADIHVKSSKLKATEIHGEIIPRLIDEIPILAVAACAAEGKTIIKDAGELRTKESDRITSVIQELTKMGASVEELSDGMIIHGGNNLTGTTVESHEDHRLAMSLAVAALVANGTTYIQGANSIAISYPEFWQHLDILTQSIKK
ncbi:MAG TPA: 3-phosphoshikimate 1-carboxyvinyltransferase [Dehalococcoidia bacterium]|nr:3-phosphoshikimate 1-carboxyvinyltransferase [Dehalococcoidia bacterium]